MKKLSCAVASCCRSVKKLTAFIRKKKSKPRELNDSGKKRGSSKQRRRFARNDSDHEKKFLAKAPDKDLKKYKRISRRMTQSERA